MQEETPIKEKRKYIKTTSGNQKKFNTCVNKLRGKWNEYKEKFKGDLDVSKTYLVFNNEIHES